MRTWVLKPIDGSGSVRIRADNEIRAREIADIAFKQKVSEDEKEDIVQPTKWNSISWKDPHVVSCTYESDDLSPNEGILNIDNH